MNLKRLVCAIGAMTLFSACLIPDLSKLDLDGCFLRCKGDLDDACGASTPQSDQCLTVLEDCFNGVSVCSDDCLHCESKGTCTDENECNNNCAHMANSCTDLIKPCFDNQKDALIKYCIDPLLLCTSSCIRDAEEQLGKK